MSFTHPLLAWGALLGSVPIVIHLLARRRYRIIRWAAMGFLRAALAQRSRTVRIQDLMLLTLRVLVLVTAAMAVARPIVSPPAGLMAGVNTPGPDCVIVIDTSYSMRTNVAARTRLAWARQKAHAVLASLPGPSRVGVLYMDEQAVRATDGLIVDRTRVGAAIDAARASAAGTDAEPAMAAALEMLKDSSASDKRVFVVTDAQARAFDRRIGALQRLLAGADPSISFVVLTVCNGPTGNLAVTDLQVKGRCLAVGAPVQFDAHLADIGNPPAAEAGVELWVGGRKVDRQRFRLSDRRGLATFCHRFNTAGLTPVEVRLDPDAVDLDNHRYAAVCIPASIDVAVVTSQKVASPGGGRNQTTVEKTGSGKDPSKKQEKALVPDRAEVSAHVYVEAALSPPDDPFDRPAAPPFVVRPPVSPDRLAGKLDDEVWVVVLADPGALAADAVRRLEALVRCGGSVLIAAGPRSVATLGPFRSGERGAGAWLSNVSFTPPERSPGHPDRGWQLKVPRGPTDFAGGGDGSVPPEPAPIDFDSPGVREAVSAVNVLNAITVEPAGEGDWSVLLRLTDGRAALLIHDLARPAKTSNHPRGRLALFACSLDPSWCDLPYRPAMVPVLHGLLSWLSRPRLVSPTLLPGQVWSPPLASGAGDLKIGMPDGSELEAAGFMEPGRLPEEASLRFDRTRQPGVYRLIGPAAAVARTPSALQAVAVNVDPAESDQAFWSPARIRSLFPQGRCEVVPPDGQADAVLLTESSGREIWPGLAVLLAAGLLAEALLAYRFSFQKKARVMPAQPSASFRTWGSPA